MKKQLLKKMTLVFTLVVGMIYSGCRKDLAGNATENATFKHDKNLINAVPASEVLKTVGNGSFYILNRKSGKYLDVAAYNTADGSAVLQYGGSGGTNQTWTLTQLSGGYYSIIGVHSNKSLQLAGTTDGAELKISTSNGGFNQQWQFIATNNGYYRIVNRNSGKDLDVNGQSVEDNAKIIQWGYWGGENQQWALISKDSQGQLGWQFSSTSNMTPEIQARITAAMNDACARYNAAAPWPARIVNVEYNTGVQTADANASSNNIRFGPNASYQNTRTAMHELGHIWGVGQTGGWYNNTSSGTFTGATAQSMIKSLEGPNAVINTGGGHFWPYGLNYDSEWSETNAYRHVKLVYAMRADGI